MPVINLSLLPSSPPSPSAFFLSFFCLFLLYSYLIGLQLYNKTAIEKKVSDTFSKKTKHHKGHLGKQWRKLRHPASSAKATVFESGSGYDSNEMCEALRKLLNILRGIKMRVVQGEILDFDM